MFLDHDVRWHRLHSPFQEEMTRLLLEESMTQHFHHDRYCILKFRVLISQLLFSNHRQQIYCPRTKVTILLQRFQNFCSYEFLYSTFLNFSTVIEQCATIDFLFMILV